MATLNEIIQIRINSDQRRLLQEHADELEITFAQIIRDCIEYYISCPGLKELDIYLNDFDTVSNKKNK